MRYLLIALLYTLTSTIDAQIDDPSVFKQLQYRFIGPEGNRAIATVGEPGNHMVAYVGAASGGPWKTEDGGVNWNPILDSIEVSSISALAISQSDPSQVWAGTGETFIIRPAHSIGNGIYKTTNSGKTWTRMGLEKTARIGRIVVHPTNPDIVYAAALGHTYGPQEERGVYRTKDGGQTWEKVLFVDENTGAADIAMDSTNPNILYAGTWQVHINTWGLNSGGPGSGIFRSTDGGDNWERMELLVDGEQETFGKTAIAISASNPNVVYALAEASSPLLFRSNDGGNSWDFVSHNHTMAERAPYYTRFAISPDDEDVLYFTSVRFSKSIDGGKTLVDDPPRGGGDTHDIWIDPTNPDRFMVADDGGLTITLNKGKTFQRVVLPIAQMYHVAVDNQIPYNVYGNRQDGYSYRGPSNSRQGFIPVGLWRDVGGCESGFAQPDPVDNNIVWSGCYDGGLQVFDLRTGHVRDVRVWPEAGYGWPPAELKHRWHWNFPIHISPHDNRTVYVGSQYVNKTTDMGQSWEQVSPDLTLNLKSHQQSSGGVATDNLMTYDGSLVFAIAESPVQKGLIWVGTNDGQISLSKDGGSNWENITANITGMPEWGTVANIEPSKFKAGTAYISYDMHQMGDFDPYIYKTEDFGQTWQLISADIPKSILSFVHVVKEDPKKEGMLFAGTDNSVYFSPNDGESWMPLRNNMPPAPVYWLTIQDNFDDLVVATYGRGFYILDDISPLRQFSEDVQNDDIALFNIRDAYRFEDVRPIKTAGTFGGSGSHASGQNPPYGADINFYLKDSIEGGVAVEILDPAGEVIRTLTAGNEPGVNRIWWNLRYESVSEPELRTIPPGRPWVTFNDNGVRELYTWDLDLYKGKWGPKVVPGTYTVRLKAGDHSMEKPLRVLKDPNTTGDLEAIQEQVAFSLTMIDDLNEIVAAINEIELLKVRLLEISKSGKKALKGKADELYQKLQEVEGNFYDTNLTGAREDAFRSRMRLYGRYSALSSDATAYSADFKPTNQQKEVYTVLKDRLIKAQQAYQKILKEDLEQMNKTLTKEKIDLIVPAKL
ncbi:MAG: glycosyl hydrolase [Cyclobacteriaceae bacterium]